MSDLNTAAESIGKKIGLLSPEGEPGEPEAEAAPPEADAETEVPLETGAEGSSEETEGDNSGEGESLGSLTPPASFNETERAAFLQAPRENQEATLRLVNSQQSTFTKKSQEMSAKVKEAEEKAALAEQQRQNYLQALENLPIDQPPHTEEKLAELKRDDPTEWVVALEENRLFKESQAGIQSERKKARKEQEEALAKQHVEAIQKAVEQLPELIPEWADEKVATKEKSATLSYLRDMGYEDQVISSIVDPRIIAITNKARKWDDLQAGKDQTLGKVRQAPNLGSPEARRGNVTSKKELEAARKKLKERGNTDAAAEVFRARFERSQ